MEASPQPLSVGRSHTKSFEAQPWQPLYWTLARTSGSMATREGVSEVQMQQSHMKQIGTEAKASYLRKILPRKGPHPLEVAAFHSFLQGRASNGPSSFYYLTPLKPKEL